VHCYAAFVINDGSAGETEPDLARLAALLEETESALVVEGSHFDARHRKANHVLARVADPAALAELRSALRCVPGADDAWRTDRGAIRRWPPVSGRCHHLRSHGLVDGDVELPEPERLFRWLALTAGNAGFAER
jgi:hypothetical protein